MPRVLKSIFLFLFLCLTCVSAEEITITSYFPSPYGSYKSLNIYNQDDSGLQTDFTQAVNKAGLLITTDYVNLAYTPGIFWSTQDNNPTKPKAGIYLRETNTGTNMYLGTSNSYATGVTNDAIVINPAGQVTKPVQAAFVATYSGAISAPNTIIWSNVLNNVGSNYSAATGRFTAPVAGMYMFGFNILLPYAPSGEWRIAFYRNGANYDQIIGYKTIGSYWQTMQGTIIIYLNASDYVTTYYVSGSGALYNDTNFNRFWGYLLG